jgi:glycerol kinase
MGPVTKLRWLALAEPDNAARTAAVCLPHDWLTWRLSGAPGLDALRTDRSEASGTRYWSAATGEYRLDLLRLAFGRDDVLLPQVLGPTGQAGLRVPINHPARSCGTPVFLQHTTKSILSADVERCGSSEDGVGIRK